MRRILIVRALHLGDLLCAVPAWRALRRAFPDARIVLAGLPWARDFVERFRHVLDAFIEFPALPGLPEREPDPPAVPRFLAEVRAARFDLALQMHGNGSIVNPVVALSGAAHVAGFYLSNHCCPDSARFIPYPEEEPEVRRHLRLVQFLGVPLDGETLEFPITEADEAAASDVTGTASLARGGYAIVHPGARSESRRWPAESFGRVASDLTRRGLRIVLTGSRDEAGLTRTVASFVAGQSIDLAGRTDLGALAVILRDARLVVCNDTGVSHLAAALRVPSVVVFSGSETRRWRPLDWRLHRAVRAAEGEAAVMREARALEDGEGVRAA